jgi:hypothetical protein
MKTLRLTSTLVSGAFALAVASLAQAQIITDVLVRDGSGNTIANNVRSFDENEAGSGLAIGFTPVVGSTFTFLYQANVVAFNNAAGQPITPLLAGLNQSFASGGYEFTVVARITEQVTNVSSAGGVMTAVFSATGGTASIFFDNATGGGVQSNTAAGNGFDDGRLVGLFNVVAGAGFSTFTTLPDGTGLGATSYDFDVAAGPPVNASFISSLVGPITDLHFTSSQVLPPGTSTTGAFHTGVPNGSPDLYPTTPVGSGLLLKVDGSHVLTAIPEPETYALMLAGLGAIVFVARRRRR